MKMRWMLVMALAVAAALGVEAPKTADEVMKFAAEKSATYKTWSADMRQSVNLMGVPLSLQGRTWFKSPRSTRTEMQMPLVGALGQMLIIMGADGITWQEMDMLGQKKITKINMNQIAANLTAQSGLNMNAMQNPDPARQWENDRQFMAYTLVSGGTIGAQPMWVLEGKWKPEAAANPVLAQQVATVAKTRLHIGQQDGFTYRIEQFDRTGEKTVATIDFTNVKFNENLDDAMFQYRPPAGIEAIDITDMSLQMIKQGIPATAGKSSSADKP